VKRALVLMGHPAHGGIMRSLGALDRGAAGRGWELTFVFPGPDPQIAASGLAPRARYLGGVQQWRRLWGRSRMPRVLTALIAETRRLDARLVYAATLSTLPYALMTARLCRRGELAHVYSSYDAATPYRKHWLGRARYAVVPSRDSLDRARRAVGRFAGPVEVIYNGVDIAEIEAAATRAAAVDAVIGDGGPVVGMVAHLDRRKNPMALIEAIAEVVRAQPTVRALLVGEFPDPAYREAVLGRARTLGILDRVLLAGQQANPFPFMRACDVIALPTLRDPFPIALLEAMALAKPVVASAVGGIPEMIVDGESGFVVPPHDGAALATRLTTLLQDPARRTRMGRAARQRLEDVFRLEGFVERMFQTFDAAAR
jgi:glycosyltransferase involved in cell wall biosynthesis